MKSVNFIFDKDENVQIKIGDKTNVNKIEDSANINHSINDVLESSSLLSSEPKKITNNIFSFDIKKPPTLCFITMCKNEEHCILKTLESVANFIDYWIVCDTGSTDKTCEIVTNFFKEKNIPGELFVDEWQGFDKNKTLMFERAYKKTDYVLHLDADDFLVGTFQKDWLNHLYEDKYNFNYMRGSFKFVCSSLYNNHLKWIYLGVAHNIIKCIDKTHIKISNFFTEKDIYVDNNERGARKLDPNKYLNDAVKLRDQFFETLYKDEHDLCSRSVFYAAQSYMDCRHYKEAIQWYSLYTKLKNTWIEEEFEAYLRIGKCMILLNFDENSIKTQFHKAIDLFKDRAEPYFCLGKYYNDKSKTELGYTYLKQAQNMNYEQVIKKYTLFVNKYNYGKYVNDELSVSCYWTNRGVEGYALLKEILGDPDFSHLNERLEKNKEFYIQKFENL
jgi:glycosyltransferase involved in cell wall biosynthesis